MAWPVFKAIGEVVGNVLGTSGSVDRVIDKVANGIDKAFYTNQEKAEARAKEITEARTFLISWLDTTKGQNIARRMLAFMIVGSWMSLLWFFVSARLLGVWLTNYREQLFDSAKLFSETALTLSDFVWIITLFYFAAPHMGPALEVILSKVFGKKKDSTSP